MTSARTPAVGGIREVPVAGRVARDYLLLALRLDQHLPGTVDGYFGPAALKAQIDMEQLRSPARLADDAAALRARLGDEVPRGRRAAHWLDLQLVALETLAAHEGRRGDPVPRPGRALLRVHARAPAGRTVRGRGRGARRPARRQRASLAERLAAEDARWTVPPERLTAVVDALVPRYREWARPTIRCRPTRTCACRSSADQPWTGYNWYDGGYRSRVDFNLDLPIRLPTFVGTVAHETYPGHHLEHAPKEQVLVEELGHLESSVLRHQRAGVPASRRASRTSGASSSCRPKTGRPCSWSWHRSPGSRWPAMPRALRDGRGAPGADRRPSRRCSTRRGSTRR